MSLLGELQRRKVIRVAGVYLVVSWLLLQIAATVAPILTLPPWFEELVLVLLGIGFPVALILAWALELTPDGVRSDPRDGPAARGVSLDYVIVAAIVLGAGYILFDRFTTTGREPAEALDRSVAILPFASLGADGSSDPVAAGIHSDLLAHLSRIKSLRTISRTSMLRYKDSDKSVPEIAAELDVATVLEGDVQRVGDTVRINVILIDAAADEPLWAEVYDRELTAANVFAIQSQIALAIGGQLQATFTGADIRRLNRIPTDSYDAWESYQKGKQILDRRTLQAIESAIEYFESTVQFDPSYALGWSGLADAYMLLPEYSSSVDRKLVETRARQSYRRALELNPELPEVRATEAWYQLRFFDWDGAERIFREALAVNPENTTALHWLSHTLSWQGRFEEAVAVSRLAVEIDPDSNIMRTNLAYILVDAGEFEEGLRIAAAMRELRPEHTIQLRNLYLHELRAGLPAKAANSFVSYVEITGGNTSSGRRVGDMFVAYFDRGEVGVIDADLIAQTGLGSEDLAQVLASVGDAEGTIAALQVAAAERSGSRSVFCMKINPGYDFIRDDPRFIALLEEVGLAD